MWTILIHRNRGQPGRSFIILRGLLRTLSPATCHIQLCSLYPVPYRTKNCVSIVAEFASSDPVRLIEHFAGLLDRYTLSEDTGMAVYTGFDPSNLLDFAWKVKRGEVTQGLILDIDDINLRIVRNGRGIIGAVAAIPFYTRYEEALTLCKDRN